LGYNVIEAKLARNYQDSLNKFRKTADLKKELRIE